MAKRGGKRFSFKSVISTQRISAFDLQTAETILARLVARAYAADHPELFPTAKDDFTFSGLSSAARADAVAPAARDGSPEANGSVEQND